MKKQRIKGKDDERVDRMNITCTVHFGHCLSLHLYLEEMVRLYRIV